MFGKYILKHLKMWQLNVLTLECMHNRLFPTISTFHFTQIHIIANVRGREMPTKWVRLDNMYVRVKIYKKLLHMAIFEVRKSYQVDDGRSRLQPHQMRCNARQEAIVYF